ncbi:hypothetical protein DYB31_014485 [Aphanomyces astaci]|uniref:Uncharacterized protein n=1 Tax=Aphanomyces astaci TaxID=112090 RepID=A0A397EDN2_APHAT|nr:hypothetical protein DYB31_014485 [Aphanomyces astaci]
MKKNEVNKLKQVIHQLELTKAITIARNASSKVNRMLSWKDVAEALLCDRRLAESQHKALAKDQIQNKKHLLEMYQWVLAQVSLQSRSLGKQWITRQMYHNRDRIFQQYGYPSLDTTAPEYISMETVRRLPGGGGIVARNVLLLSQLFTAKDGLLSLEEDAKSWGIDLDGTPDHLKEARYPQMFMEVAEREIAKHRAWYIANRQTIHV